MVLLVQGQPVLPLWRHVRLNQQYPTSYFATIQFLLFFWGGFILCRILLMVFDSELGISLYAAII